MIQKAGDRYFIGWFYIFRAILSIIGIEGALIGRFFSTENTEDIPPKIAEVYSSKWLGDYFAHFLTR